MATAKPTMDPSLLLGHISDIRAEHMIQTDAFDIPCKSLAGNSIQYSTDTMSAPIEKMDTNVPAINNSLRWRVRHPNHPNKNEPPGIQAL
jgi:hypothetical protein